MDQAASPPSPHVRCWVALVGDQVQLGGVVLIAELVETGGILLCGDVMAPCVPVEFRGSWSRYSCMGLVEVGGNLWCGDVVVQTWFGGSWVLLSIWCSDLTVWAWFEGHGVGVITSC